MEVVINYRNICDGGPARIAVADGSTTVGQVIALFKQQTGVSCAVRLKDKQRVLRSADTLEALGIRSGHAVTAVKNAYGSPAYQALRRIEKGVSTQSRAHRQLAEQVGGVATAVSSGFERVEAQLQRTLECVAVHLPDNATPQERISFLQNRRATDLNHIRMIRDSRIRERDEAHEANARPKAKARATAPPDAPGADSQPASNASVA